MTKNKKQKKRDERIIGYAQKRRKSFKKVVWRKQNELFKKMLHLCRKYKENWDFFSEPMERTTTTSIAEPDQIDFFSVRSGFQEKSSKCSVIEDISGQSKSCKFPFVLRNETFYGCTLTGRNRSIILDNVLL